MTEPTLALAVAAVLRAWDECGESDDLEGTDLSWAMLQLRYAVKAAQGRETMRTDLSEKAAE